MSPVGWWPVLWNPEESYYGLQSHFWLYLFNLISSCSPIFITQQGSQTLSVPSKNQPPSTTQPLPGLFSLSGHLSSPHLSCFAVLSDFHLSVTFLGKLFLTPQTKLAPLFSFLTVHRPFPSQHFSSAMNNYLLMKFIVWICQMQNSPWPRFWSQTPQPRS